MLHRLSSRVRRRSYLILAEDMSKVDAKLHVRQTITHVIIQPDQMGLFEEEGKTTLTSSLCTRAGPRRMGGS